MHKLVEPERYHSHHWVLFSRPIQCCRVRHHANCCSSAHICVRYQYHVLLHCNHLRVFHYVIVRDHIQAVCDIVKDPQVIDPGKKAGHGISSGSTQISMLSIIMGLYQD